MLLPGRALLRLGRRAARLRGRAAAQLGTLCPCRPPAPPPSAAFPRHHLQSLLAEIEFRFEDVCARGDRVAVLRRAKAVTKDGRVQPQLVVIDVWHVHGGKVRHNGPRG